MRPTHDDLKKVRIIKHPFVDDDPRRHIQPNDYHLEDQQMVWRYMPLHTLLLSLLAILNSRLLNYFLRLFSTNSNVNGYEVDNLPIAMADVTRQKHLTNIASRVFAAKQRDAEADTSALEREIDELVYALYGLTPEEIKLVEGQSR